MITPWILALGFDAQMAAGQERLAAGACVEAATAYQAAGAEVPDAEDAWVGAQRAWLCAGEWAKAANAGSVALALNPHNAWALRGQGYALHMTGDLDGARRAYEACVALRPDDAEARLGLGFVRVAQGDVDEGHALCRGAASGLPLGDPRIDECLAPGGTPLTWGASVSATYLRYTDPYILRNVSAISFTAGVDWAAGGLWGGATLSGSTRNFGLGDYQQANPVLGGALRIGGLTVGVAGSVLFSSEDSLDGTGLVLGSLAYRDGAFGGGVSATTSIYPNQWVEQLDARFEWAPAPWLSLVLGPELQIIDADELLASGSLSVTGRPHPRLALFATGIGGPRRWAVDDVLLSVWTNSDRVIGGYRVGVDWTPWDVFGLTLTFRHDFGDEQAGLTRDFQIWGGTLGARLFFQEAP